MDAASIIAKMKEIGIIPVVAIKDEEKAVPLAEALIEGGLPAAEITFRTDAAEGAIKKIHEAHPEMLLIAGTVLTVDQAKRAVAAGAHLIVAPGFNPTVVDYCLSENIPVVPGVMTPSEMEQAIERGLTHLKFFPAEPAGGLKMINAVCGPYTMLRFMPTGGLNPVNVRDYLASDKIYCCGGSWMVKGALIDGGEWDKIKDLCREAVAIVKEVRG